MAETPRWQPLERDPDFEPLSRPRSCTWPLPRPDPTDPPAGSGTSSPGPPIKQEPGVSDGESFALLEESAARSDLNDVRCPQGRLQPLHHRQVPPLQAAPGASSSAAAPRKSGSSRRNAWGSMSYADLITRAIDSSPEQRLTLAQIYDWMVRSVPYFKDKGDNNSSAGWKNSIRHNLSLHSRFVRMQNEGTGKSSWWMLNPEGGKNGKSPRRRAASMDNNSKFTKSRGRASKKKVTLQEGLDGATASPRSQYPKWVGSPSSHSNDDFETWSTFRTRASSDASTLSGRRSPFLSEQDDLGEADVHAGYPGGGGVKIAAPLPSLTELTGSVGQHGRQHVMESLLDNLNLISPKISQLTSDSSRSPNAAMLHNGPYSAGGVAPEPQQDDLKCLYGRQQMNSLPPVYMQAIPDAKQGFGPFQNHYNCPAGLLKELLTSDANPGREKSPSMEAVVSRGAIRGCAPPSYSSHDRVRRHEGVKMMNTLPQLHAPLMHRQGPSGSQDVNRCNMIPLTSLSLARGPPRMTSLRTCMQTPHGHSPHSAAPPASYGNGYRGPAPPHPHLPHQEGLPSDLDNVSIERFECDMESVLHDTLMDGDALDFNFDPTASAQMFPQRVKNSSHSWVSG